MRLIAVGCIFLVALVVTLIVLSSTKVTMPLTVLPSQRFTVTRMGVFPDSLAYSDKRGVYMLKDTQTGEEWVGVSGIGVSTLGSHSDGEDDTADER